MQVSLGRSIDDGFFPDEKPTTGGTCCMPGVPLIAIVDDDDSLRKSLDNLLRSVGFRTQAFSSADPFLSSNHIPDLACLILDMRMPGMSGLELQLQLGAANWSIPIIFVTAQAD